MANDVSIISGIIIIFVLLGVFLPTLQDGFGVTQDINDVDAFEQSLLNGTTQMGEKSTFSAVVGSLSFFDYVKSILLMFLWTFGALPLWLDTFFVIFRIILLILLVRLIRSGGG